MYREDVLLCLGLVQFFCIVVLAFVLYNAGTRYEAAGIAHHAAHYDGQTGKFTWNEEAPGGK